MRVLALINHEVSGPGVFAEEVRRRGHAFHQWAPSAEPLPCPLTDCGAVIAFGGGMQVDELDRHPWLRTAFEVLGEALERQVPTLGVCLGAQMIAHVAGGAVGPAPEPDGVPVTLDVAALEVEVAERLAATTAAGRGLCARFLVIAEER